MSIAKLIAFNNCLISTAQSRRFTATEDKMPKILKYRYFLKFLIKYLKNHLKFEKI